VAAEDHGPASVAAALRAGARGVVGLDAPPAVLARGLEAAAAGLLFLGPSGRDALLGALARPSDALGGLSRRERDVLERLARGDETARIARRLGVAPKTVRNHVAAITGKLGARDRADAGRLAREAGLMAAAA
jgi:two-component system, NarL family, response regulator DesR